MTDLADRSTTTPAAGGGYLDDTAMIRRIFEHLDNGTTDLADDTWREPVANYHSPERLRAELAVLRRYPTPFCPTTALAEAGSFVAREAAGTALVAVRGHDGVARVFRNSCRHRGTAVAEGSGCAKSLVCPYHGWVYRLDGELRHVPDEYGFPGLDKTTSGLVEVQAEERGGMVFVTQDAPALGTLDGAPDVLGPDHQFVASFEMAVDANWKVFLEGFLEGYHIKSTHPTTFFPYGYDNVNLVEYSGRNSRVTFPFRRIEKLRDVPEEQWDIDGRVTTVHHLFPNTIVAQLSHHTSVAILEPISPGRTNLVTYAFTNRIRADRAESTDAKAAAQRDSAFVAQGTAEDRAMVERVQRGLSSGANEYIDLGRFEGALSHFHRNMAELLTR
jgi:phenylpropionate dioxygenase-like ring-hydroxylating dioxygenase large terminal subunit